MLTLNRLASLLVTSLALLMAPPMVQAASGSYTLSDLGPAGGDASTAITINQAGSIAGLSVIYDPFSITAVLWQGGTVTNLGAMLPAGLHEATAINNAGQVVGWSQPSASVSGTQQAVLWRAGGVTTLTALGGHGFSSLGLGINNLGQVVGVSGTTGGLTAHATLWASNGSATDLGAFMAGANSEARGINDAGLAVGQSWLDAGGTSFHAALWGSAGIVDLGTLAGGDLSSAYDINANGMAVGWSNAANGDQHAVVWASNGAITALSSLGGHFSHANAINSSGYIVGSAETSGGDRHAVLWADGGIMDLNTLLDPALSSQGWVLVDAMDINDLGSIVGKAVNIHTGDTHGFLMAFTPAVPEPNTLALVLAGAGLLGLMRRRADKPQ